MADLPNAPATRREQFLNAVATGNVDDLPDPITREEMYLDFIAENASSKEGVTPAQVRSIIAEQTDDALSSTSENAVQNKAINTALNNKADINDIPTKTSDLTNDSSYVADNNYVHTDNNYTTADKSKLNGIDENADVNVQSDWSESNSSSDAYIRNKPSSLPANGGNADTVGGYPAAEIVKFKATDWYSGNEEQLDADDIASAVGIYACRSWQNTPHTYGQMIVVGENNSSFPSMHGVGYPQGFQLFQRSWYEGLYYRQIGFVSDGTVNTTPWREILTTGNCPIEKEALNADEYGQNYAKFPNGLTIQWGWKSNTASGDTFTFPYAFSTAPSVTLNRGKATTISSSGFTYTRDDEDAADDYTIRYMAVGYIN